MPFLRLHWKTCRVAAKALPAPPAPPEAPPSPCPHATCLNPCPLELPSCTSLGCITPSPYVLSRGPCALWGWGLYTEVPGTVRPAPKAAVRAAHEASCLPKPPPLPLPVNPLGLCMMGRSQRSRHPPGAHFCPHLTAPELPALASNAPGKLHAVGRPAAERSCCFY